MSQPPRWLDIGASIAILSYRSMVHDYLDRIAALLAMPDFKPSDSPHWQQGTIRWLALGYCLFILYGSFIPFHFNLDANFVRWRWESLLETLTDPSLRRYSTPDAVSNLLLFAPFGFLLAVAKLSLMNRPSAIRVTTLVTLLGSLFASAIEIGQTLTPMRTPSIVDILSNSAGSAVGAILGCLVYRQLNGVIAPWANYLIYDRPSLIALLFLILGPLIDGFYPFDVTLDVSSLWNNIKHSQFIPLRNTFHPHWGDIVVEKSFPFAVIGYIVLANFKQPRHFSNNLGAWLICIGIALAIESGKLFFNGRAFNGNYVVFALAGAGLGIVLYRALEPQGLTTRQAHTGLICLAVGLLSYFQLEPFDWISQNELAWKVYRIEWFPFAAYYWSDPRAALFDLLKKIYLSMPIGFLLSAAMPSASRRLNLKVIPVTAFLGVVLEACQIMIRSRTPSVTDVMIITLGAWLGIQAYRLYESTKTLNETAGHSV